MPGQPQNRSLLSPSSIGDVNRSRVLQALCDHGAMSRADLAKVAGVTRATIGNIVQGLIDDGLLEEGAPQTGTGRVGKPGTPVWFGRNAGLTGAAAISAEGVEAAVVNARGDVVERAEAPLGRDVTAAVVGALESVLPRRRRALLGIGVAVPGVVDTSSGAVVGSGQLPALDGVNLVEALTKRFGEPVLVDNDSRAQALGEKWFGDGKGVDRFVSVQTGHGIGAGIVIDGVVLRGPTGLTGEVGHTSVDLAGGPCRCGLRGCWETIATLGWLRAEAKRARIRGWDTVDAARLVELERTELLAAYADHLAIGIANLVNVMNPEVVILHGDAVGGGEVFRVMVEDAVRARSLVYLRPTVKVVLSRLDQRATLLGAAGLVLSDTFNLTT